MLYLSEFQTQPEYERAKRAKSAFSWSGDVIPDEKPAQDMWSPDHDLSKISRALFSRHVDHVNHTQADMASHSSSEKIEWQNPTGCKYLFDNGGPGQDPVLTLGGFFQHALVDAFLLGGRRVADELRERSRGDCLGFSLKWEHGLKPILDQSCV